jgi:hypothetical protein
MYGYEPHHHPPTNAPNKQTTQPKPGPCPTTGQRTCQAGVWTRNGPWRTGPQKEPAQRRDGRDATARRLERWQCHTYTGQATCAIAADRTKTLALPLLSVLSPDPRQSDPGLTQSVPSPRGSEGPAGADHVLWSWACAAPTDPAARSAVLLQVGGPRDQASARSALIGDELDRMVRTDSMIAGNLTGRSFSTCLLRCQ